MTILPSISAVLTESQKSTLVGLACAWTALVVGALIAWWQARRDRNDFKKHGIILEPDPTWLDVVLLAGACVFPVAALTQFKDDGHGGTHPYRAITFAIAGLLFQAICARRVHRRIDMRVGLVCGAIMGVGALVYAFVTLSKGH